MDVNQYHLMKKAAIGQGMNDKVSLRTMANNMGGMTKYFTGIGWFLIVTGIPFIIFMGLGIAMVGLGIFMLWQAKKANKTKQLFLEMVDNDPDLPEMS